MPTQRPLLLRPLRIGEILDVAIKIYSSNARMLIAAVAVFVVPLQILQTLIQSSAMDTNAGPLTMPGPGETIELTGDFWLSIAGALTGAIVLGIGGLLATAACFKAVSDVYLGQTPTRKTSVQFALQRLGPLMWLTILIYLLATIAAVPFILPGIWLWVSWVVATPVLLLEDARGFRALGRSFKLVRGRWWPTFAAYAVALLIGSVVQGFFGGIVAAMLFFQPDNELLNLVVSGVVGIVGTLLVVPFTAAVVTAIYIDLRVRKEGFDLQLMAERIGVTLPEEMQPLPLLTTPGPTWTPTDDAPPYWPPPPGWTPGSGR